MAMPFQYARHLLGRTGFGGSPAEFRSLARLDREAAVEWLLDGTCREKKTSPPLDVLTALRSGEGMKGMTFEQKKALQQKRRDEAFGLYGAMPSLDDLQEGDLKYQVDFRSLYATVTRNWWGAAGDRSTKL